MQSLSRALLVAAAVVTGLAAPPVAHAATPAAAAPYRGRTVCCTDPAAFAYVALPDHGSVEVDIGPTTPLFEFQSGVSAFRAFRLPVLSVPYLLEVRSRLRGGPDPLRARVFYPAAALLNGDYLVMRSVGVEELVADWPLFERAEYPAYRLAVGVDPAHGRERYLVVYTPLAVLGPRPVPAEAESADESARNAYLGASTEGHLTITITALGDSAPPPPSR